MRKNHPKVPSKEKVQLTFGAALRAFREAQGEEADLHTTYVSSVERGERNLSLHNIVKLALALDIPVSSLVRGLDP